MVVYWYATNIDAFFLECPRCRSRYDYDTEQQARDAVELHSMCGRT